MCTSQSHDSAITYGWSSYTHFTWKLSRLYHLLPIPNLRGNHPIPLHCLLSLANLIPAKGGATYMYIHVYRCLALRTEDMIYTITDKVASIQPSILRPITSPSTLNIPISACKIIDKNSYCLGTDRQLANSPYLLTSGAAKTPFTKITTNPAKIIIYESAQAV